MPDGAQDETPTSGAQSNPVQPAAGSPAAVQSAQSEKQGLLQKLTFPDILKLLTLIVGIGASAFFANILSFKKELEAINAAALQRTQEVNNTFHLLREGVLHLQELQPRVTPYFANSKELPGELRASVNAARCEVAGGRIDAIALTCSAADGVLVGAERASGQGPSTVPGLSPPSVAMSPAVEPQPP